MREIQSLVDIADQFDTYFFDMFGTIWAGSELYPEAKKTLEKLKAMGKKIVILSNATMPNDFMNQKTQSQGLVRGIHYDDFMSSGEMFLRQIQAGFLEKFTGKRDYRFYCVGRDNTVLFADILAHQTRVLEEADFIYIGSLDMEEGVSMNLDRFIPEMTQALSLNKPAICANPDRQGNRGELVYLTNGAAAQWYAQNGGKVRYFGKPYPEIFEMTAAETGSDLSRAVMVGDLVETDVLGACRAGIASVLLTESGVAAQRLSEISLDEWCGTQGAVPDFILKRVK